MQEFKEDPILGNNDISIEVHDKDLILKFNEEYKTHSGKETLCDLFFGQMTKLDSMMKYILNG